MKDVLREVIGDSERRWSQYFDKKGNDRGNKVGSKTYYPSYLDFYHAMGSFVGKEIQTKYRKKVEFCTTLDALQQQSILFSILIGVISTILLIITQGEGWPEWVGTLATVIVMWPLFGYGVFSWFIKAWMDIYFENAYHRELSEQHSVVFAKQKKRKYQWPLILSIAIFLTIMFFGGWVNAVTLLFILASTVVVACLEGFLFLLLSRLWSFIHPKKEEQEPIQELSSEQIYQIKERFQIIYHAFQKGNYIAAYEQFDDSQREQKDFLEEIQRFLRDNQQDSFHLLNFKESEPEISISKINENTYEAVLFLSDREAEEFSEFYLVCEVSFDETNLQKLELLELGY